MGAINPTIEYRKTIRTNREKLIEAHRYSRNHADTPEQTVNILVDKIGTEAAGKIIAIMVMCKGDWDERISRTNRAWAAGIAGHTQNEFADMWIFYCDDIHPAHMDQIATAYRKRDE